jgi:hypothetical protein
MNDIECPYCEAEQEINHDDGYGYSGDEIYKQECSDCGKIFTYTTSITYCYNAEEAECLNGGEHDWELSTTYPKFFSTMICKMCGNRRELTPEEKEGYKIPKNYD